jgi:NodT family efflux transporter outer membrane factor (OMF) lipoprotein
MIFKKEEAMRLPQFLPLLALLTCVTFAPHSFASTPEGAQPRPETDATAHPQVALEPGATQWWTGFEDPRLNALVQTGLGQNLDVRAAELRVDESETLLTQQRAPLMPTVSWDSQINIAPTDSLGFQFGGGGAPADPTAEPPPDVYWSGSSVLNAALELDITGRRVLDLKAGRDDLRASKADLAASEVTVASSITTAYYDLVAARARSRIIDEQIETVGELLELTESRYAQGRAVATDVLQQRQQLASTTTLGPQARAQERAFAQQLAVLLGEDPNTQHESASVLPRLERGAPAADTSLIAARPDMRAAQRRVEASEKREKVARRQFAPTLQVSANAGVQAIAITDVNEQWYWGAGASLSVPIFGGGRNMGVLRQRQAQAASSRNEVERVRLEAQRQVADAQAARGEREAIVDAATAELEFAEENYLALRERYFEGDVDVLNLLSALTSMQQAQLNLITAERDLVVAHIDLQRALAPAPRVAPGRTPNPETAS